MHSTELEDLLSGADHSFSQQHLSQDHSAFTWESTSNHNRDIFITKIGTLSAMCHRTYRAVTRRDSFTIFVVR